MGSININILFLNLPVLVRRANGGRDGRGRRRAAGREPEPVGRPEDEPVRLLGRAPAAGDGQLQAARAHQLPGVAGEGAGVKPARPGAAGVGHVLPGAVAGDGHLSRKIN